MRTRAGSGSKVASCALAVTIFLMGLVSVPMAAGGPLEGVINGVEETICGDGGEGDPCENDQYQPLYDQLVEADRELETVLCAIDVGDDCDEEECEDPLEPVCNPEENAPEGCEALPEGEQDCVDAILSPLLALLGDECQNLPQSHEECLDSQTPPEVDELSETLDNWKVIVDKCVESSGEDCPDPTEASVCVDEEEDPPALDVDCLGRFLSGAGPTFEEVKLSTDGFSDGNQYYAKEGEEITLSFESDQELEPGDITVDLRIDGNVVNNPTLAQDGPATKWKYTYMVSNGDDDGAVSFDLTIQGEFGRSESTQDTTDDSEVLVDTTPPSAIVSFDALGLGNGDTVDDTNPEVVVDDTNGDWIKFPVDYNVGDSGSGIKSVQLFVDVPNDTGGFDPYGTPEIFIPSPAQQADTIEYTATDNGAYGFKVQAIDAAGNIQDSVQGTITVDSDTLDPPMDVADVDLDVDVSDPFERVGRFVTLTATVTEPGSNAPVPNVKVFIYEDGNENELVSVWTNGNGHVSYSIRKTEADAHDYEFRTEDLANPASSTQQVIWTELEIHSLTREAPAASRGQQLEFTVELQWSHDDSPVVGMENGDLMFVASHRSDGNDPLAGDTGFNTPLAGIGINADPQEPGKYHISYAHGEVESLDLRLAGSLTYQEGAGDDPDIFHVPSTGPSVIGVWTGIVAEEPNFVNEDDPGDGSPLFVGEDDTIRVEVPARWTTNYDAAEDGFTGRDLAPGAKMTLYRCEQPDCDGVNDGPISSFQDLQANGGGVVTFDLGVDDLGGSAGTYSLLAFFTESDVGGVDPITQSPDQAPNRNDFGYGFTVTFTAVDVSYEGATLDGNALADPASDEVDGSEAALPSWWFNADPEGENDEVAFQVHATWRHDGSDAVGALIGGFLDGGQISIGDQALEATTDGAGLATVTIDPGVFDLRYTILDLEFRLIDAPEPDVEPGDPGQDFTHPGVTFNQEMLWTRIHLHTTGPVDDEVDLGMTRSITVEAYWYHDEGGQGTSYAGDPTGNPSDWSPVVSTDDAFQLIADDTAAGDDIATDDPLSNTVQRGGNADFTFQVTRGCDDHVCGQGSVIDWNQAGWHRFTPRIHDGAPHGISDNAGTHADVLWTGAVLDTKTDRLTQEVDGTIQIQADAYYAHDSEFDAAGQTVDLGLDDRVFPYGVDFTLFKNTDGNFDTNQDVILGEDFSTDGTNDVDVTVTNPGHLFFYAAFATIEGDTSDFPLTQVHEGQTLERVGLETTVVGVGGAFAENDHVLREEDVDLAFEVSVSDGDGTVEVDGGYPGYTFDRDDVHPVGNMPQRSEDPVPLPVVGAGTVFTLRENGVASPILSGIGPGGDFTFDGDSGGCDCWTATIPGTNRGVLETVPFLLEVSLPVTQDQTDVDSETVLTIDNSFDLTYTAVVLSFGDATTDDGDGDLPDGFGSDLWANYDATVDYKVQSTWAHDNSPVDVTLALLEEIGGVWTDTGKTPMENGNEYTFSLNTGDAVAQRVHRIVVTDAPRPGTGGVGSFTGEFASGGNLLTCVAPDGGGACDEDFVSQDFIFTRPVFDYLADPSGFANVEESVLVEFEAKWAHGGLLEDSAWVFNKDDLAEPPASVTNENGVGSVQMISSNVGEIVLDPESDSSAPFHPHGITATAVINNPAEGPPAITWTRWDVEMGQATGTEEPKDADWTNPDGQTETDVWDVGTPVTQPVHVSSAHDGNPAADVTLSIAGLTETSNSNGEASVTLVSNSEHWFDVHAEAISGTVGDGGKEITATTTDSNWVGWDANGNTGGPVDNDSGSQ